MPILKQVKMESGVTLEYHTALKLEAEFQSGTVRVDFKIHTDQDSATQGMNAAWYWSAQIPASAFSQGLGLAEVESALLNLEIFSGGVSVLDESNSLEALKLRKRAEITQKRLEADSSSFTYEYEVNGVKVSKAVKTADKDMTDLLSTNAYVTLFGEFDASWPGGWKALDNTYIPIPTIEEWKPFFRAMYQTGAANFKKSQILKYKLEQAESAEEVAAIIW